MADWVTEETRNKLYSDIKGLSPWIIRDLKRLNILRPTPVQFACIPPALAGRDVIGGAKTGSGKTMAFVLPILNKLSMDPFSIYALVLTPTRELAFQIADQFRAVGASMGARVSVVVGGQDRLQQCRELQSEPHIVVATPGRLYDILSLEKDFSFNKLQFLVLDEADRLLDGRFSEQLGVVLGALPKKRQTLLFSATITEQIECMEELAQGEVFHWESGGKGATESTVAQLTEHYTLVNPKVRDASLVAFLLQWREENPKQLALVFVDTCATAEALGLTLQELGLPCVTLHSFKSQTLRLQALAQFKSSQCKMMLATDLASRGLDIPLVSLVVNHRLPNQPKTYIHRVGRTARAGRSGTALTLITPEDQHLLLALEAVNPRKLTEHKVDGKLVRRILKQVNVTRREQEIRLEDTGFQERKIINKRKELILQGLDPDEECAKLQERIRLSQEKRRRQFLKAHSTTLSDQSSPQSAEHDSNNKPLSSKALEKRILVNERKTDLKNKKLKPDGISRVDSSNNIKGSKRSTGGAVKSEGLKPVLKKTMKSKKKGKMTSY